MEAGVGSRYDGYQHQFDAGPTRSLAMFIDTAGEVGIGTSSPSEKLEVAGNAILDGTITATAGMVLDQPVHTSMKGRLTPSTFESDQTVLMPNL